VALKSRTKGKVGERELVQALNSAGFLSRRTAQYAGKVEDSADILIENFCFHVEVKRTERFRLLDWLEQVKRDSRGKGWVIFQRSNGKPWLVIQQLDQWIVDSKAAEKALEHVEEIRNDAALQAQATLQQ